MFHYDDIPEDLSLIPNSLQYIATDLGVNVVFQTADNQSEAIDILKADTFDLIILDMYDKATGREAGISILDFLKTSGKTTPVIGFTSRNPVDMDYQRSTQYANVLRFLQKRTTQDEIGEVFVEFLMNNGFVPSVCTYDKDNFNLIAEVNTIGLKAINNFLLKIKKQLHLESSTTFKLYKITAGLSGAVIFRVEYQINGNQRSFLLKISADREAIRKELSNTDHYKNLPAQFRLEYNPDISKELKNDDFAAIMIEYAENAKTLFDWLQTDAACQQPDKVATLLTELFLENGLKQFYAFNRSAERHKYNFMFEKLDERRISFIKRAINELRPIWAHHGTELIDIDLIDQMLFNQSYRQINFKTGHAQIMEKHLMLNHGDFHAKNILVSSTNRPSIIDTGGFTYEYWCADISRLMVNLFIEGIDSNSYAFFALEPQIAHITLAEQIIEGQPLDTIEVNIPQKGYFHAINWLNSNIEQIYPEYFCRWEFQLNLALEFFKFSYKSLTLPPGKRTLALMCACAAIRAANNNLQMSTN
ncbi:hypothetical protein GCM10011425_36140 [Mucilaginibacter galii]|uniref:Response regulatory domain-containing protein n=2 Tax=Mucilaginibacter galii TaxID=2005073 RepID=A0A917N4R1_9SPHI|nr:hypothetical protein GCM10011425_36140 [Mucilaginibacter galii]